MKSLLATATVTAALSLGLVASAASAQDIGGKLVLYTSQPAEDAQKTVDAFTAKYPDVEVEWFRDGTTRVMAKLAAEFEAGAPQPDVLLIADSVTMEGLKADDRLMAYAEADTSAYEAGVMDPEGYWFSTKLITTGIVYNEAAPMVPASWTDLLAPEAQGMIAMPSPLTSGAAAIHMAALTGAPSLGWEYYEGLAQQGTNPQGGNGGVFQAVAGGQAMYGMLVDYLAIREKAAGAPIDFVFPDEGVSAVTEPAAILSTAANPDAARAFIDFVISEEGQQLAADMGYLPAHPGITPPAGFPARDQIRLMDFDAGAALRDDQQSKLHFTEIFGG